MFEERLERIRFKLAQLSKCWLNPKATESQIKEVESCIGHRLPEEYREFLLQIGDGGIGPPHYGVYALLDRNRPDEEDVLNPQFSTFPPQTEEDWIDKPFVWNDLNWHEKLSYCCFLWMGTDGCAICYLLGVTGSERGNVWHFSESDPDQCLHRQKRGAILTGTNPPIFSKRTSGTNANAPFL